MYLPARVGMMYLVITVCIISGRLCSLLGMGSVWPLPCMWRGQDWNVGSS